MLSKSGGWTKSPVKTQISRTTVSCRLLPLSPVQSTMECSGGGWGGRSRRHCPTPLNPKTRSACGQSAHWKTQRGYKESLRQISLNTCWTEVNLMRSGTCSDGGCTAALPVCTSLKHCNSSGGGWRRTSRQKSRKTDRKKEEAEDRSECFSKHHISFQTASLPSDVSMHQVWTVYRLVSLFNLWSENLESSCNKNHINSIKELVVDCEASHTRLFLSHDVRQTANLKTSLCLLGLCQHQSCSSKYI